MQKQKEALKEQVPEYGLEALVSTMDDYKALIAALKEASKRFSTFKQR
jgi:hypothetical protein